MSNFAYSNLRFEYVVLAGAAFSFAPGLWLDSLSERPSECHQGFHAAVQARLPFICEADKS